MTFVLLILCQDKDFVRNYSTVGTQIGIQKVEWLHYIINSYPFLTSIQTSSRPIVNIWVGYFRSSIQITSNKNYK